VKRKKFTLVNFLFQGKRDDYRPQTVRLSKPNFFSSIVRSQDFHPHIVGPCCSNSFLTPKHKCLAGVSIEHLTLQKGLALPIVNSSLFVFLVMATRTPAGLGDANAQQLAPEDLEDLDKPLARLRGLTSKESFLGLSSQLFKPFLESPSLVLQLEQILRFGDEANLVRKMHFVQDFDPKSLVERTVNRVSDRKGAA
jgi:hypothetical protein